MPPGSGSAPDRRRLAAGEAAAAALAETLDLPLTRVRRHLTRLADENFTFHEVILRAANIDKLTRMVREVTAVPPIYRSYMAYSDDHRKTVEREHRAIARALADRDGEHAAELMQAHVIWARDLAMKHFPQST